MADSKEKLFSQFPPVSYDTWRAKVDADLKGVPFDKKLVWRTNEGFQVQPMYQRADIENLKTLDSNPGEYPYVRGTRCDNHWLVRQQIIADTPAEANAMAEVLRDKGATEVFRGSVDYNPLKPAFRHGAEINTVNVAETAKALLAEAAAIPGLKLLAVNSEMFNNAGAYIYQELGYALAWGAQWMTLLTDAGVDASEVARRVKFNMGISSNYFMELAKFRAARMMWAQVARQYGADEEACKMNCHAVTSRFNQTLFDAHVNLLRSQTEAMSAALAGVDSITVTPFDAPYQTPDEFSQRIARNQQLLLKEESHLDKVADPAGGSYYVETLTVSLAQEAWKLFMEVDAQGGFFPAVNAGKIQEAVNASCRKRHDDMARRKEVLLGTNQFPNFNEFAAEKVKAGTSAAAELAAVEGAPAGAGESCGCKGECSTDAARALCSTRMASDFELLRLATEKAANRPKVFMLTIGNLAMRLARAQFSSNFFGCAGYEIIDNIGFDSVQAGIDAAIEKGADIVVLCSSDDEYATFAPEAFRLLDGRAEFVVAGAPACTDDLKAQGIENFIHVRSNVLDTLRAFNDRLLKK